MKASTALSNGITASFTDYAGTSWTNQDYVVANIGTLALNTEYEIFFRLRNRYVADWKESTSPKVMLKVIFGFKEFVVRINPVLMKFVCKMEKTMG